MYYSFIYPYLIYCNLVWGNTKQSYMEHMLKLQKRSIRIICSLKWRDSTSQSFRDLKIVKLSELYMYTTAIFMYKIARGHLPEVMNKLFVKNNTIHRYNTRQENMYHLPIYKTDIGNRFVKKQGILIWSDLCKSYECNTIMREFKVLLIAHILCKYQKHLTDFSS